VIFIAFIPQFIYWHLITGKWYIYAYGYKSLAEASFTYWNNPRIGAVLAGPVSGWLAYTPVLIAGVAGMIMMVRKKISDSFGIILIFLISLYIISSWWCYTFDCGFGHRGFIDYYALFAIPMAFAISSIFKLRSWVLKTVFTFFLIFLSYTNIRMSMMYSWDGCWNGPSWTWKHYSNVVQKAAKGGDFRQDYHQINH
jgi:hypothetical protein